MSDWLWGFLIELINKGDKRRRGRWGFQWERRELLRGERDRFGKSGEGSKSKSWELPWCPVAKTAPCNAGDEGSIPAWLGS